jgi:hypothetical protein
MRLSLVTLPILRATGTTTLVFYVRFDVEYRSAFQHIESSDTKGCAFDLEHFQDRHADGVGPDGRTGAKYAHLLLTVGRRLSEEPRSELGTSMKVEDHDHALARFYVFEPFQVCFVDYQFPLRIGDVPMPGDFLVFRAHETDRPQFDARAC